MKKSKKVKDNNKKVKMELSKNVFDNFLHIAGNTPKSNDKKKKKK